MLTVRELASRLHIKEQEPSPMEQRPASQTYVNFAEVAIRSTAALMEMQIGMARHVAGMQARNARLFGIPDYTEALDASVDRSRRLVSMTTDHLLNTTQRIGETMTDLQGHFARMMEQQARTVTEEMCRSIDRIGGDAEQALRTASQQVSRGAQEVERAADARRSGNSPILRVDEVNEKRSKETSK